MKTVVEQINDNFKYHTPRKDQPERYNKLREKAKELALLMVELCPNSRERALAITKLEESSMWANAAIAREE